MPNRDPTPKAESATHPPDEEGHRRYRNILCLAGYLDQRDPASEFAFGLVSCFGGTVHVLLILDAPFRTGRGKNARGPTAPRPLTPEIIEDASERLVKQYRDEPYTRCFVLPGNTRIELARYVERHSIDLVVMCQETFLDIQRDYGNISLEMPCPVVTVATLGTHDLGFTRPETPAESAEDAHR